MGIVVQKFGGTSVASMDSCAKVVAKVRKAVSDGHQVVVVVSAMGRRPAPYATDTLLDLISNYYKFADDREKDAIASCGEIISTAVLASALKGEGLPAMSMTGFQAGIMTDGNFTDARIISIDTARLKQVIAKGVIPVVAGFQGVDSSGDVTTLGRGGSDTTAAALGAALKAIKVEIFTDVEGVMTADPRIVPDARFQKSISYHDMAEMAILGSKVVHPRAVEIAMKSRTPLVIRSTFSDSEGTVIDDGPVTDVGTSIAEKPVSGVTHTMGVTRLLINLIGRSGDDVSFDVLGKLAAEGISIDMISLFADRMAFIVAERDADRTEACLKGLGLSYSILKGCGTVSVVGQIMRGIPGVMSKVVKALRNAGIEIIQTSDSHNSVSCLIREDEVEKAARALHSEFEPGL
jgi:aspartate kinase